MQVAALPPPIPHCLAPLSLLVVLWLLVAEALGNGRAEKYAPLLHILNCAGQKAGGGLLEQISRRARLGRFLEIDVITVGGDDD
jgi:hypothetical protein